MEKERASYGYYHVEFIASDSRKLLSSNNERAFIVSLLQDLLSPRLLLSDIAPHKQLASCIDLLAFSITSTSIHLLLFAIDASVVSDFTHCITARLSQYQFDYHPRLLLAKPSVVRTKKLRGPHQALAQSIEIHALHEDWEYDRYSSIGFYLHDRRGDWMRIWRLSQLYENTSENYRTLLETILLKNSFELNATVRSFAS